MEMQVKIKGDPALFSANCEMISKEIANVEACWRQVQDIIENTDAYWQGSAGKAHYRYYMDVASEVSKLLHRLKNAQQLLRQQAGLGDVEVEGSDVDKLPDDVLV